MWKKEDRGFADSVAGVRSGKAKCCEDCLVVGDKGKGSYVFDAACVSFEEVGKSKCWAKQKGKAEEM